MQFNYFDVHSHLNLSPLWEEGEEAINKLIGAGVGTVTVGTGLETSERAVALAERYPKVLWATVGQHPNDNRDEAFDYEAMLEMAKRPKVVAIGECGIDFYRIPKGVNVDEEKARQEDIFRQHIRLANEVKKPLMIHARPNMGTMDAYTHVINILEEENFMLPVNFHFFVGDSEIANRIVGNGWTMSFDGPITFTSDYEAVIREIPLQNIMAETDAPYAAPMPHRGQMNRPEYVEFIYKKIAEIKGVDLDTVQKQLISNANRVFSIN